VQIRDLAVFPHGDALPAREVVGGGKALRPADLHLDRADVDGQPGRVLARDAVAVAVIHEARRVAADGVRHHRQAVFDGPFLHVGDHQRAAHFDAREHVAVAVVAGAEARRGGDDGEGLGKGVFAKNSRISSMDYLPVQAIMPESNCCNLCRLCISRHRR